MGWQGNRSDSLTQIASRQPILLAVLANLRLYRGDPLFYKIGTKGCHAL